MESTDITVVLDVLRQQAELAALSWTKKADSRSVISMDDDDVDDDDDASASIDEAVNRVATASPTATIRLDELDDEAASSVAGDEESVEDFLEPMPPASPGVRRRRSNRLNNRAPIDFTVYFAESPAPTPRPTYDTDSGSDTEDEMEHENESGRDIDATIGEGRDNDDIDDDAQYWDPDEQLAMLNVVSTSSRSSATLGDDFLDGWTDRQLCEAIESQADCDYVEPESPAVEAYRCVACQSAAADSLLLPCRHLAYCLRCTLLETVSHRSANGDSLTTRQRCPVCRRDVDKFFRVFAC